jgi:hypothetical protein
METCVERFVNAPMNYVTEVRKLPAGSFLMRNTKYSPAYGVMIISSALLMLGLAAYIIYYFFTTPNQDSCYKNVIYGVYGLSIIYLIESIFIFILLAGGIAKTTSDCWKIINIIFFGMFMTGFGFGGLGIIYLCFIQKRFTLLLPTVFLLDPVFI